MLPRTVDRRNTHVTDVTRDDNNACVTAAVRMLLNQADTRSQGKLWEWREPRSASMYLSPRRRCHSLTFDAARHRTTHAADRHTAVYLWLAIAKVVSRLDDWSCLMQPRRAVHAHTYSGIKQLQSLERPQEWRDVTCDKWTVGIGFHTRTLPASHPWCLCIASPVFPTICSEAVCGLSDRCGWPDGAADCCLPSIWHDY